MEDSKYFLEITAQQARLLYYSILKSGMGNSDVPYVKEMLEKLDKICENP